MKFVNVNMCLHYINKSKFLQQNAILINLKLNIKFVLKFK